MEGQMPSCPFPNGVCDGNQPSYSVKNKTREAGMLRFILSSDHTVGGKDRQTAISENVWKWSGKNDQTRNQDRNFCIKFFLAELNDPSGNKFIVYDIRASIVFFKI